MKASLLRRFMNLWPPLLCSGIAFTRLSRDYRSAEVVLRRRWFNQNMNGTHFGGSIFAMTDAPYALMIGHVLGPDYVVWDKSAEIEFIAPGIGDVTARVQLAEETIARIYKETEGGAKYLPEFEIDVVDRAGELVARARRMIYIRKKRRAAAAAVEERWGDLRRAPDLQKQQQVRME